MTRHNPNAVLRELRDAGVSPKHVAARAQLCGMTIKGTTIYGEAYQWTMLREALIGEDFTDLIYGRTPS